MQLDIELTRNLLQILNLAVVPLLLLLWKKVVSAHTRFVVQIIHQELKRLKIVDENHLASTP